MTICYFTATGNCLYVAERIGGTLLSISQLMKQNKIEIRDDAVGTVCPTYVGEMPKMMRAFMEKASIHTDYLFFVATYGMDETWCQMMIDSFRNYIACFDESNKEGGYVFGFECGAPGDVKERDAMQKACEMGKSL